MPFGLPAPSLRAGFSAWAARRQDRLVGPSAISFTLRRPRLLSADGKIAWAGLRVVRRAAGGVSAGAGLAAAADIVRAGSGLRLVRQPEGGELALPSQAALELLAATFPPARQKLTALGFGLVQQDGQA